MKESLSQKIKKMYLIKTEKNQEIEIRNLSLSSIEGVIGRALGNAEIKCELICPDQLRLEYSNCATKFGKGLRTNKIMAAFIAGQQICYITEKL